jgi:hypothetical protein
MGYDVFISYSISNAAEASELEATLNKSGLTCFLAEKSVLPGEVFDERIRDALLESKVVCFLATPDSLGSEWVVTEWGAAWALAKPLIPVLLRCAPKDLPDRLRKHDCVDFHRVSDLLKAIRELQHANIPARHRASRHEIIPYASGAFRELLEEYLRKPLSAMWLLSYTGETTDGMLVGFQEMRLDIEVRLLVRDWKREAQDKVN